MTHCECGNLRQPRRPCCDRCQRIESERLEGPSERLARLLQREGEWMLATDIADMAGADRVCTSTTLLRLTQRGLIEQMWRKGVGMMYRAKRRAA